MIRVPDERGDQFTPRAVHVADTRLAGAVRTILERPQRRPSRSQEPLLLDVASATRLGGAHALLTPFLEKGSTAALLPITAAGELLAELTILSLDPAEPIDADTLATARTIAQQAALAIDNARLYQQQKQFAETMQQSLLPSERPDVPGLEVGDGLRVGGAGRRRRRRLRLHGAPRRPAGGRARRRHRARDRRDRRHGDGEVRLPVARTRASRAVGLPGACERRRRGRDRRRQVHHDGVPH